MSSAAANWFTPRRSTLSHIAVSMVTWPLVLAGMYWLLPDVGVVEAPVDRLLHVVTWSAAPAAVLMFMVLGCMRIIDTDGAEDPFAGAESRRFQITQRVVQNTIEQMGFFLPALFALSVTIDAAHTRMLSVLVLTWCLGRVVFWIGYQIDPEHRSLGFGWTQNTAMLTFGWLLMTVL